MPVKGPLETVMHARFTIIAAAALTVATAALAEPAKAPSASQTPSRPSPVVLASADRVVGAASTTQASPTPAKRPRAARVTNCRCGAPQAEDQDQEQQ